MSDLHRVNLGCRSAYSQSAAVHRALRAYAEVPKRERGHTIDLNSLGAPMLMRLWQLIGRFDEREDRFKK
ncbi:MULTISPECIES: DUF2274 domain-containing protein [unclassified Bradyrhizobium]